MRPSSRLDRLPPYLFAELERKISEKRAAGVDVISLGIGDPDTPTPAPVVEALAAAAREPGTHRYPSNRGRPELREAFARFYERRFGVTLDPDDAALAADPGYPVYTGGPLLTGGEPVLMPLLPERGFAPDLEAIAPADLERARLMYLNYPNNPTGAVAPDGLFEQAVALAREHGLLVVHDASYTETTFEGYVAPSFLETPGAREIGVEVFSLSKGWNMTGWRTAALVGNAEAVEAYWKLKTNVDSGMFEAVQLAAVEALEAGPPEEMRALYARRRDMVCDALAEIGVEVIPPKGTIYVWAPVPDGHTSASYCELVLDESGVVLSPGSAYGPNGEGFFRISLTVPDERLGEAVERLRSSLGG